MEITEIMKMLDWNNSAEEQKKGLTMAKKVKILNVFLQTFDKVFNKNIWENCAKVICSKSDEELTPYFGKMIEWTQDLNWPGAEVILERIKKIKNKELIKVTLDKYIITAKALKDMDWTNILNDIKTHLLN